MSAFMRQKNILMIIWHKFPNVEKFMNETVEKAKKDGYVTTMFGRKRYVPELSASNKNMQAAGKRIAMNTPIQGSAGGYNKNCYGQGIRAAEKGDTGGKAYTSGARRADRRVF